jgi:hypothetical protein
MTTLHEAAKLAVLPLESAKLLAREEGQDHLVDDINAAIEALRSALAQQGEEQGEPVAWIDPIVGTIRHDYERFDKSGHQPLYAAPQPAVQEETANPARVLEWMRTPNRKPAQTAFTAGPERQAAYWIEIAQGESRPQAVRAAALKEAITAIEIANADRLIHVPDCVDIIEALNGKV